ncbi:zincin-like metallopeptidase toxin domain-containing protein [Paenibacillus mucilaginosus]|uniref:Rhs core protein n=1 Tax=Paenibacillus mucilaginosus (strain KNP414) TaxID=1036673 RepID=F8FM16_PAEMK|nr:zincin-like metallopeptidase toxin domain-containing protein [Paenibacillus mucilaginosus]AEI45642.1 Rhs core protein [Paenibacillus mucilaginosus KNP414]MCG7215160.1 pre-toxin TG domain-containing protein [Paenibacillus mucilaginosus]WDM27043.1 WXG100 family type VII secretion target [Paenibacillus mucilaginosus]
MRIRVEPAELDQVRRDISGTLDRLQSIQSHLKHQMRGLDYEGGRRSGLDHRWERIDRQFRELSEQYRELGAFVEAKKRAYLEADNHGQRAQGGGKGAGFIRSAVSMGLDFLPVVGNVKGIVEAVTGRDPVTGQKLTAAERALGVLGPFGKGVKQGAKLLKLADETAEAVVQGAKQADKADEAGDAARAGEFDLKSWEEMPVSGQTRIAPNGQRLMSISELKNFRREMASNNIKVVIDKKDNILPSSAAAGFDPDTGEIVLRREPTYLSALHESYHANQWSKLGKDDYMKQSALEREEYVYNEIIRNKDKFSEAEILFSQRYIYKLRSGHWPPQDWKGFND